MNPLSPDLDIKRRKSLARLILASSDIQKAIKASQLFKSQIKSNRHPLFDPLQEAAVISYSRPFTDNKGVGALPNKYSKYSSKIHNQLHKEVLTRRNVFVAHSDSDVRDVLVFTKGSRVTPNLDTSKGDGYLVDNFHYDIETMRILNDISIILLDKIQADILLELESLVARNKLSGLYELISLSKRSEL